MVLPKPKFRNGGFLIISEFYKNAVIKFVIKLLVLICVKTVKPNNFIEIT